MGDFEGEAEAPTLRRSLELVPFNFDWDLLTLWADDVLFSKASGFYPALGGFLAFFDGVIFEILDALVNFDSLTSLEHTDPAMMDLSLLACI